MLDFEVFRRKLTRKRRVCQTGQNHNLRGQWPRKLHTAGRFCDILYTPNNQNVRGVTPILADISLTHPFTGNAGDRDKWGIYQKKNLCQRAQIKSLKHAWAENEHVVVPFVSGTLGSMSGESAAALCLFAWCQAGLDGVLRRGLGGWCWGRQRCQRAGGGVKAGFPHMGCAPEVDCPSCDCGEGHRPRSPHGQESGVPQEQGCPFP